MRVVTISTTFPEIAIGIAEIVMEIAAEIFISMDVLFELSIFSQYDFQVVFFDRTMDDSASLIFR